MITISVIGETHRLKLSEIRFELAVHFIGKPLPRHFLIPNLYDVTYRATIEFAKARQINFESYGMKTSSPEEVITQMVSHSSGVLLLWDYNSCNLARIAATQAYKRRIPSTIIYLFKNGA